MPDFDPRYKFKNFIKQFNEHHENAYNNKKRLDQALNEKNVKFGR